MQYQVWTMLISCIAVSNMQNGLQNVVFHPNTHDHEIREACEKKEEENIRIKTSFVIHSLSDFSYAQWFIFDNWNPLALIYQNQNKWEDLISANKFPCLCCTVSWNIRIKTSFAIRSLSDFSSAEMHMDNFSLFASWIEFLYRQVQLCPDSRNSLIQ